MRSDPRLGRWSRINRLIADAAARLGARVEELTDVHTDFFLRLVDGEKRVIVSKTRSPFLPQIAQSLSNNKYVARRLIADAGVPVVEDALIEDLEAEADRTVAEAMLRRHRRLVVKPNWGNRGVGVIGDVCDMGRLERAFDLAFELDQDEEVLLERHVPGHHLRATVIGGRFAAAAIIDHLCLVGDGEATVASLIDRANEDPRRGVYDEGAMTPLDRIEPGDDHEAYLQVLGLSLGAVPAAGERVMIWTEEAETIDVTARLHPDIARAAEQACAALGVDVGGVDLIVEDPGAPLAGNGCVLEVNVLPALHLHALPTQGEPQPVFDAFVRYVLGR